MCREWYAKKEFFYINKFGQFPFVILVKPTKYLALTAQTFCSKMPVLEKLFSVVQV